MREQDVSSRRTFLALTAASAMGLMAETKKHIPVGLLLFAVRDDFDKDLPGTLKAVAKMGYEGVELFGPYFYWTPAYAKQVRAMLDDLGLPCFSTHNESPSFTPDGLTRTMELNQILGSRNIVAVRGLALPTGRLPYHGFEGKGLDGWKRLADRLSEACERMRPLNMTCGFHNHAVEFVAIDGTRPIDILGGVKDLVFHLDTALVDQGEKGSIDFIGKYPGRIQCVLCADWPKNAKGNQPLLGQGKEPWKETFASAESKGGIQFYLIQQETSDEPAMEAARKNLEYFRHLHA
jgi:sugar phosphate isomerase/epimerase